MMRTVLLALVAMSDVLLADDFDMDPNGGGDMDPYGGGMDPYGGMGGGMDDEYGGGGYGGGGYGGGDDQTPAYELLEDAAAVAKFISDDPVEPSVIGFFDEERDAAEIETFQRVADGNRFDFRFAYTIEDDVRSAYKFTKGPAVLVYKAERFVSDKFDKKRARYPGKTLDGDALTKFIFKNSLTLVGQRTWKSADRYDKSGVPVVTLFAKVDLEKNPKGFDYFANRLRKVAADYVGQFVFNIGDKEDFSYILADFGLEDQLAAAKDVGVGCKDGAKHYKMDESFSVENVKAFVEAVKAGTLTPKVKEPPAYDEAVEADAGEVSYAGTDVVQLTDANFEAETKGKDAFLEFYAPWCGHCKTLKPAYAALAAKLKHAKDAVVVGAMDATSNSPPAEFDVAGYPTIFFKPNGGDVLSYDGNRDAPSMLAYIKEHATSKISDEL